VARGAAVVCVLTGNGLKDAAVAAEGLPAPTAVSGDASSLAEVLGFA
jgi:threonine synthase